jgi:Na+/H+ antiporter NhaD/arsenite permease-like protein
MHSVLSHTHLLIAYIIFFSSYLVFAVGSFPGTKIDRPAAAIIGAALMFAFRVISPQTGIRSIDFATLVLLFSMMLIAANLHASGFFDWVTLLFVEHLSPRLLLPSVIFVSGILSAFLVNDIVCLLMAPLVVRICREMSVRATPYLLALATASNIGSAATITGNPQNILIGSTSGIPYRDFLFHLGPVALAGLFADWLVLHLIYMRPSMRRSQPEQTLSGSVMDPIVIKKRRLVFPLVITSLVLAGFLWGAPPALVAAIGGAILLVHPEFHPRDIYGNIDWALLVFFTGLFLIVGAVEQAGIAQQMLLIAEHLNLQNLWIFSAVTALLSNIVSNVPAVILLKDLAPHYSNTHLFWLMLAMTSTLAGNLTITGSVANIIVVEKSRADSPITFMDYLRAGVPVTIITMVLGVLWLKATV